MFQAFRFHRFSILPLIMTAFLRQLSSRIIKKRGLEWLRVALILTKKGKTSIGLTEWSTVLSSKTSWTPSQANFRSCNTSNSAWVESWALSTSNLPRSYRSITLRSWHTSRDALGSSRKRVRRSPLTSILSSTTAWKWLGRRRRHLFRSPTTGWCTCWVLGRKTWIYSQWKMCRWIRRALPNRSQSSTMLTSLHGSSLSSHLGSRKKQEIWFSNWKRSIEKSTNSSRTTDSSSPKKEIELRARLSSIPESRTELKKQDWTSEPFLGSSSISTWMTCGRIRNGESSEGWFPFRDLASTQTEGDTTSNLKHSKQTPNPITQ